MIAAGWAPAGTANASRRTRTSETGSARRRPRDATRSGSTERSSDMRIGWSVCSGAKLRTERTSPHLAHLSGGWICCIGRAAERMFRQTLGRRLCFLGQWTIPSDRSRPMTINVVTAPPLGALLTLHHMPLPLGTSVWIASSAAISIGLRPRSATSVERTAWFAAASPFTSADRAANAPHLSQARHTSAVQ